MRWVPVGHDTHTNISHQAGPRIPKDFPFSVLPNLNRPPAKPTRAASSSGSDDSIARRRLSSDANLSRGFSELDAKAIFVEEHLLDGIHFAPQPKSEPGKKPDSLPPLTAAYRDQ